MNNENLFGNLDELPYMLVREGLIIEVNKKLLDMTEYTRDELLKSDIAEIFAALRVGPKMDINNIDEKVDYFLFTKSLEVRIVNIRIIDKRSEKMYIFLEKINSCFYTKCEFTNTLYSDNYYGIAVYSAPDITLLKANEKYLNFFDESCNKKENCMGKHISEFIPGFKGSSFEDMWTTVLKTGNTYNIDEYMYEGLNRGKTYWKLSLIPICEDNEVKYCIAMTTEITAQVLYKKKLEEQLEMKNDYLSFISHELRTPLNVICSALQAMDFICGAEMPDKANKFIGMIRQNSLRQLRLVNNLLDIIRVDAGRIKFNKNNIDIVFLTKAIIESVHNYADQKGINIKFISKLKKKVVGIDEEKYEKILLNLISNAIKFTPEGTPIEVYLRSIKCGICIEVKDYGIGIPPDKTEIIFEKFGQVDSSLSRQAEGAGIGLSLVKKFVESLGGSISVKSKVGLGSTFTVLLPNETITDEQKENEMVNLLDDRLIQTTKVEFSDIYVM